MRPQRNPATDHGDRLDARPASPETLVDVISILRRMIATNGHERYIGRKALADRMGISVRRLQDRLPRLQALGLRERRIGQQARYLESNVDRLLLRLDREEIDLDPIPKDRGKADEDTP